MKLCYCTVLVQYCNVEPVCSGGSGPQRIDRQTRRRGKKGGHEIVLAVRDSLTPSTRCMHATVTVPLPHRTPPRHPKNQASDGSMLVRVSALTHADARRCTS